MKSFPTAIADALDARPWLAVLALAGLAAVAVLGALRPSPRDTLQAGPEWTEAEDVGELFAVDDVAGLLAVFGNAEDSACDASLRDLERSIEALPWVASVTTPWDVPGVTTIAEARVHPLLRGTLALDRGLLLPVRWAFAGQVPRDWVDELQRLASRALAGTALEVGVTGKGPVLQAQDEAFGREQWRFQILGTLLGFAIASIAFRNVRATFLAGLPPLVGVAAALGVARFVGLGSAGLTAIVLPLLVLTIGFTDSLHVVVAAARARRAGAPDGAAAARVALLELFGPCALTSFTTALGFASLATTGSAIVTDFGLTCALATGLSFLCVFLTFPLLCRTPLGSMLERIRPPSFDDAASEARGSHGLAARGVERGVDAALARPRAVSALAVLVTLACAWAALGLRPDRRVSADMSEDSAAARTLLRVDAELGGALPLNVRIDWDEGVAGEAIVAASRRASDALMRQPLVSGAIGPAQLADAVGGSWTALALLPVAWRSPFLRLDERSALVHARIPDEGSRGLTSAFDAIAADLKAAETPGVRLRLVGEHFAFLRTVERVTYELGRSLILAAVLILLTLAVAFRSWRLGLASAVPNLLPLAASAAGLAYSRGSVDVSTLTALTLSLGIATDDTIHVLARWRRAREDGLAPKPAARRAVLRTYPALAVTTMTLTTAFALLLTSSIPSIRDFGRLAATTLVVAFFADVWLLPALVVTLAGGTPGSERSGSAPCRDDQGDSA